LKIVEKEKEGKEKKDGDETNKSGDMFAMTFSDFGRSTYTVNMSRFLHLITVNKL
jgi:hypothetical protein